MLLQLHFWILHKSRNSEYTYCSLPYFHKNSILCTNTRYLDFPQECLEFLSFMTSVAASSKCRLYLQTFSVQAAQSAVTHSVCEVQSVMVSVPSNYSDTSDTSDTTIFNGRSYIYIYVSSLFLTPLFWSRNKGF